MAKNDLMLSKRYRMPLITDLACLQSNFFVDLVYRFV